MSKKCQKRLLSINEDTKAVLKAASHFEENTYQGDDLQANTTKQISLFNAYQRLKYPPPVHNLNFTNYLTLMFSILGLKVKI